MIRALLILLVLGASAQAAPPFTEKLLRHLVLYYSFDEAQGESVTDQSASGNHAVLGGGKRVPGRKGGGLSLNGSSLIATNRIQSLSLHHPSIALWVKPKSAEAYAPLVYKNRNGDGQDNDDNYLLMQMGSHWTLQFEDDTEKKDYDIRSTARVRAGVWQHLLAVYDGLKLKLYINGKLDAEQFTGDFTPCRGPGPLELGGMTTSNHASKWRFKGVLDEIMIFNRPLNDAEIKTVFDFASGN